MKIWVDADACPNVIKTILFRAASRCEIPVILVANQSISTPPSPFLTSVVVSKGFDVADNYIVEQVQDGDLVVTADIPLAAEVVEKGAQVITPRGERLTKNNVRQRLNMRDFMEEMRSSGLVQDGPPPLNNSDKQQFANALDTIIVRAKSSKKSHN